MNLKNLKKVMLSLLILCAGNVALAASAGTGGAGAAFSKNSISLGFVAGSGSAFNEDYVILGAGFGYYLVDGLELGVDVQRWFSGSPSITKISPQVRYVFTQPKVIKPYFGLFYRRTIIEDFRDYDSIGYRAGAYFSSKNGVYIGGGIVYEEERDCPFVDCSNTYPEILITVGF
jgi:hypothetical protein